jgi:hypothetical protein
VLVSEPTAGELVETAAREGWNVAVSYVHDKAGPPVGWDPDAFVFAVSVFRTSDSGMRVLCGSAWEPSLRDAIDSAAKLARIEERIDERECTTRHERGGRSATGKTK